MPDEFKGFPSFHGFVFPNTTQIPNMLIDHFMPDLGEAELKTLLYIVRRTYGFGKQRDNISLSQMLNGIVKKNGEVLDRGTGLSKPSLLKALTSLRERKLIRARRRSNASKGDLPTSYGLIMQKPAPEEGVVKSDNHGSKRTSPRGRQTDLTTQNPVLQQKEGSDLFDIWSSVLSLLAAECNRLVYKSTFASSRLLSLSASEATVTADATAYANLAKQTGRLEDRLAKVIGRVVRVKVVQG